MNYKILIILFILLISPTSAIGIENTFDEQNKTLIIEDSLTENKIFEIQQVSIKPDLTTMEEVFKITSYEDYTFKNYNDFKVRWEKFEGEKRKNIFKSKWEILENVEYSVTVPDYIDIGKQITIDNIQSNEDVTYIFDSNPWLLDAGELHATNKWAVTSPNGIVTIGFDNHVVNSINPSNITFYWNTTEQIDTHIEPKYSMEWIPFSPAGKTIKKDESIIVKLTFHKKAEKGNFSIQTIPTFVGVEETNFTWWNGSWNYCINNQIPYGIRPYQLPVTISNSAGTNSETNVYFNGHAKPDFSDIRFTLDDTTVLPYWIEDRGSTGKVWVNVIDNGIVNIYYGNPSATDLSDGKSTFEFFDDFSNLDLGSNPVLSPDEPWESPDLRWGTIAYLNGIYYIYYSSGSSATADIGRATSTDLIHWTKYDNNPMIQDRIGPSLLKELDGFTPVFYDNKYWMLTMKSDGNAIELRSAPSIDSNDWTLENGNLIPKVSGTWYENYLYTTSFFRDNGKYYICMEARDNSFFWRVGLFDGGSSPTGPYSDQGILLSATLPWEGGAILDPEMRKFGDIYYLFYTGNNARPVYQNSYATSSNLDGPYIKSGIKITPISNTYPAILEKDDFYYILTDDHIPIEGIGKNLYKRKDLNGMFGSPFDWYQGGSPTFSNSELLINADGDYIRSQSAFLYKAMKIRAKFAPLSDQNTYQYFGFAANSFAGVANSEMIVSYDDPDLKTWSGNTVNYENSSIYDPSYFGSYHDYEILWRNGEAKFIVDDVLKATQTTYVANTPQPVGIFNYKTNASLYVDWVFVRNYVTPELTWAIWSIEHTSTGYPPTITDFSPASPVADDEGATRTFSINIDQSVDVVWYLNDDVVKDIEMGVTQATYINNSASIGTWNIRAVASNTNGEAVQTWTWIVSGAGAYPEIIFTEPTPADGATITQDHTLINTLVTDSSTAFIDWDNSLTGWWRFNHEDGETPTFFRDWSSYGNDVICSGINCPTLSPGKFGNALSLDGSDDYVFTTSATGIPVTSLFTIESWVNAQSVSDCTDIFRKEGSWALQINPEGKVNFEITGKQDTISDVIVPANIWTHLAITFEGTTVNFYKDGILCDTKNQINVPDTGSNSIYIGGYSSWYFNGALDEIKIHNRILSPGEIQVSYNAGTNNLYRDFTNLADGTYHYKAYAQDLVGYVDQTQTRTLIVASSDAPIITDFSPASPVSDDKGATRTFSIDIDQSVDVVWYINNNVVQDTEMGVTHATYTNTSASIGTWNVKATTTNANGTVSKEWSWTVTANSPDDWYDTNWKYRKAIEINNTGNNLIDYQIDVTIDTQSLISSDKLKSDGSDLRFVDSNNNVLPFWNEDEFNSFDTTIWVMVPVVSNADETTIYMYYGNPDANTIADGDETFEFFETNFMKPLDNSDSYLNTPTYNGSGQAIHPDIYYNSSGWNGYSYWMVMTPYPGGDDNYENPSILVSNDGISWTVPGGLTNPIDPTPETGSNSDTEIVYNENLDRLEVYYVESGNGTSYLKRRTSTDGISWSNEENIFNLPDYQVMSPSIIKDGSTYHMWYNDADSCSASENYIQYITSLDGVNWSAPQSVNINQPGQNVWHSDVKFIPFKNEYWMMYAAYPVGSDCSDTELYFATSTDKFNWTTYSDKILAKGRSWDSGQIYRAAFLYDSNTDNLRVWYSAKNNSGDWHTGYTQRQYSYFADGLRWSRNGNSGSNTTNPRDGNYGLMQVGGTPYPVHELSVRSNSKGSYSYTVWYKDELSTNSNYQATLNLHHGETWSNVGVYTGASSNNYTRAISGSYTDTGIARTPGWHKFEISLTDTGMCFVIDGVPAGSTTSITSSSSVTPGIEGYLAGIAYFDDYYIRKYACPEPTYMLGEEELEFELELVTIDDGDSGSSSGSSSSGGGGGGTSGEAFENILLSETDRKNVYKNADISYSFDLEGNIIRYVNFTGLTSSGKVAAKVEILNNTSSMVDSAAPEIVYKNVNIFVGIAGWATSQNIVNPTISFIVEKNWINDNNIDVNSIHIYRYSNGVWKQLPTFQTGEDTDYLFFESETPDGYSQFAVSGKVSTVTPGGESTEPTTGDITGNTTEHIPEEKPGIPGFSLLMGLLVVLIVVQWQRKK